MQDLILSKHHDGPLKVLCLGAHCDDIEIGCGGTILRLVQEHEGNVSVLWQVFSSTNARASEARACAEMFLQNSEQKRIDIGTFRDGFFPAQWAQIKEQFEDMKQHFDPDVVLTHYRDDRHQDHRVISDLTWNTYRDHFILEYEIPKYDGDMGSPNLFVNLPEALMTKKVDNIMSAFVTQQTKHWLARDTLMGIARLRGMESGPDGRFAEGFYARKLILGLRGW